MSPAQVGARAHPKVKAVFRGIVVAEVQYSLAGAVVVVGVFAAAAAVARQSRRCSSRNIVRVVGRFQVQPSDDIRSVGCISRGGL